MRLTLTLLLTAALAAAWARGAEEAPRLSIFPIDQATILSGSRFDVKIEFPEAVERSALRVTINEKPLGEFFGREPEYLPEERTFTDKRLPALRLRDCILKDAGEYTLVASDGNQTATVTWKVFATAGKPVAKNVILMVGDGMSVAHRTAARVMSKNLKQGKYNGKLAMDDMPHMALVGTAGAESLITDSANSAHAYTTGHKSSNGALGVYADRTPNQLDDPRVENIGSLAQRMGNKAIGLVTDAEIQDATPGAIYAHTRRRDQKQVITDQLLELKPDVALGGGSAFFLSIRENGKRIDGQNMFKRFAESGYTVVRTKSELLAQETQSATKLLGVFAASNMDGVLDREFLKGTGWAKESTDQPALADMTRTALNLLSRKEDGFFLLVEGGLIDKYSHVLDWERAVMDTIQFDQTVGIVKEWAAPRNDTLILVVADHTHGVSIVGVIDDKANVRIPVFGDERDDPDALRTRTRDKIGINEYAGFPNYVDANRDGYPDRLDVSRRLSVFFTNFPDYYETFAPKLDGVFEPTVADGFLKKANTKYKNVPGAQFREGNLPRISSSGVHTAEDVILTATGPGSEAVRGFMDNTEIFRLIVETLGLKAK